MGREAVVGHVEWMTFAVVDRVPGPGDIAHASETWADAGGGGGVAAQQLAKLAGSCDFFTALGDDELGRRSAAQLARAEVEVFAAERKEPTRRGLCLIDAARERTIITLGPRLEPKGSDDLPWERLEHGDAVYVTAGDVEALRRARTARVMVVSSRHLEVLAASGIRADAVVGSARDPKERYDPRTLVSAPPSLMVLTEGAAGGRFVTADGREGRYEPAPIPAQIADTYGSGDSFQAGLAWALGEAMDADKALEVAARCGAAALTGRGAGGQLTAADL